MGYGQAVILIEGDHTSDVDRILETFDNHDIENVCEASTFIDAHKTLNKDHWLAIEQYQYDRMSRFFYIIGFHKGWTVIEQITPADCEEGYCRQTSSMINGKVVSIGIESHVNYYEVILCDKGHTSITCKKL